MTLLPHTIIVYGLRSINHPEVCQLVLAPDEGSQVVLDVVVSRGGIKSIIFEAPDDRAVEIVTNILHIVVLCDSVSELSTPSILHKLLFHFITSSA